MQTHRYQSSENVAAAKPSGNALAPELPSDDWTGNPSRFEFRFRWRHRGTIRIGVLLLTVLALITTLGCDPANPSTPVNQSLTQASSKTLKVNVFKIELDENVIETAVFFGKLKPNRQSRLGFGRGGQIAKIYKRSGDEVLMGEKLAELDQSQLETQKRDLQQALASAKPATPGNVPGGPAPNQQQIDQLETSLRELEIELNKGVIMAPYDCLVAEQNVDEGSLVSVQLPAFEVVEDAPPVVEANLSSMIANGLANDQSVWILIGNKTAQAQVKSKSPQETAAGTRTVLLQVNSQLDQISWAFGQTVEIRFFVPTDNSGYWIPLSSLNREATGLWSIFVADPPATTENATAKSGSVKAAQQMVELVQLEDDWALVRGALSDGQAIVVNGSHRIVPGQQIETNDVTSQYTKPDELGAVE